MMDQVWVVDDDQAVRDSLRLLLQSEGYRVAVFADAVSVTRLTDRQLADCACLLLDIRLPGMDGMGLQLALAETAFLAPIVFITGHGDVPLAVQAMQRGALDFLTKPLKDHELLEKVAQAVAIHRQRQTELQSRQQVQALIEELTNRERQVMFGISAGLANKQIAAELDISPRTVEIYRARVMEKMQVDSVAALVRTLTGAGLLDQ